MLNIFFDIFSFLYPLGISTALASDPSDALSSLFSFESMFQSDIQTGILSDSSTGSTITNESFAILNQNVGNSGLFGRISTTNESNLLLGQMKAPESFSTLKNLGNEVSLSPLDGNTTSSVDPSLPAFKSQLETNKINREASEASSQFANANSAANKYLKQSRPKPR